MDFIDRIKAELDALGYQYAFDPEFDENADVAYLIQFNGNQLNENISSYLVYAVVIIVNYTGNYLAQEKLLATSCADTYPVLAKLSRTQLVFQRVSFEADPDTQAGPENIGMRFELEDRDTYLSGR